MGYPISLNFNRKGETFNTVTGGIVSIALNVLMLYLFFAYAIMSLNRSADIFSTTRVLTQMQGKVYKFDETENLFGLRVVPFDGGTYDSIMKEMPKYVRFESSLTTMNINTDLSTTT